MIGGAHVCSRVAFGYRRSLDEALAAALALPGARIWIGGGRRVYAEAFKESRVDRLYLTEIRAAFEGDVTM